MRNAAIALILLASPAFASGQTLCQFTLECLEDEACNSTDYAASIEMPASDDKPLVLVTDSETLTQSLFTAPMVDTGLQYFTFFGNSAVHLITVNDQNDARYTIHMVGPMAITYHGTCEETQ